MNEPRRSPKNLAYTPSSVIKRRPELHTISQPLDYSDEEPHDISEYNQQSDNSYNSISSTNSDSFQKSQAETIDSNVEYMNCSTTGRARASSRATGLASHKNHFIFAAVIMLSAYALVNFSAIIEFMTTPARINCNFDDIRSKLPEQDEYFWKTVKTGVEYVINNDPTAPSTYLLLYNDTLLAKKILREIINRIKTCMNTDHDPIIIHSTDLETTAILKDHGNLITEYRDKLSRSQIMTIKDINELPGQIAQSFHYFCDEYNPVVHRAVIIFTLNISNNKHQMPSNYGPSTAIHLSESILKDLWSESLHDDVLNPLIARMTENVLYLRPKN